MIRGGSSGSDAIRAWKLAADRDDAEGSVPGADARSRDHRLNRVGPDPTV